MILVILTYLIIKYNKYKIFKNIWKNFYFIIKKKVFLNGFYIFIKNFIQQVLFYVKLYYH